MWGQKWQKKKFSPDNIFLIFKYFETDLLLPSEMSTIYWMSQEVLPNLLYKSHQIPKPKCFSFCLTVVFAHFIEAMC